MTSLEQELAFAHELADLAARITSAAFGSRLEVQLKADRTPVTQIDGAAERAIRDAIEHAFPMDGVLGEEEGRSGGDDRLWLIDPIDGTKHYADGVPLWTTMIALSIDDEPVLGIVDAPALEERYEGVRGAGARRNGEPIAVSSAPTVREAFVIHSAVEEWMRGGRADALLQVLGGSRRSRGLSDAWGQMLVASGAADALLEHEPCGAWDWAASSVIVQEAGGSITALDGSPLTDGCDLLVTNGHLHGEVLDLLTRVQER